MKKLTSIIGIIISLILINTISYANTKVDSTINATKEKVSSGDTIVFTVKLDNFQEVERGINAYKATLQYDKEAFEEVKEKDFKSINDWEDVRYNPETGEFVAYKKSGITTRRRCRRNFSYSKRKCKSR